MPTTDSELLRAAIRTTLAQQAGNAPTARAVADAALNLWQQMAARLAPVIGVRGVDILFGRALHLTSRAFPWLVMVSEHGDSAAQLANFKGRVAARIAARDPSVASEASCALLLTFTELLATLIGEPLTERLLAPVWAPPPPAPERSTPHD